MELTASAGEDVCAAPCCASSPRRTVSELCERGLHRNRLEPLTIAGRALRNRDGLVAQFSLERHGGSIASVRFKASTCATLLAFCELIAELVTTRNIDECVSFRPQFLLSELPEVPLAKRDRALLALAAFHSAVSQIKPLSALKPPTEFP